MAGVWRVWRRYQSPEFLARSNATAAMRAAVAQVRRGAGTLAGVATCSQGLVTVDVNAKRLRFVLSQTESPSEFGDSAAKVGCRVPCQATGTGGSVSACVCGSAQQLPGVDTSLTNWWNVYDSLNTWRTYHVGDPQVMGNQTNSQLTGSSSRTGSAEGLILQADRQPDCVRVGVFHTLLNAWTQRGFQLLRVLCCVCCAACVLNCVC